MDFSSLMNSVKGKFGGMAPEAQGFAGAMANGSGPVAAAGGSGISGMQHAGAALGGFGAGMTTMDPAVHRSYEQGSAGYSNMAHAERIKDILGGRSQHAKVNALRAKYSEHFTDPEINNLEHGMGNDASQRRGGAGTSPTGFDYKSLMAGGNS